MRIKISLINIDWNHQIYIIWIWYISFKIVFNVVRLNISSIKLISFLNSSAVFLKIWNIAGFPFVNSNVSLSRRLKVRKKRRISNFWRNSVHHVEFGCKDDFRVLLCSKLWPGGKCPDQNLHHGGQLTTIRAWRTPTESVVTILW